MNAIVAEQLLWSNQEDFETESRLSQSWSFKTYYIFITAIFTHLVLELFSSVQFIPIANGHWGAWAACTIVCQLFRSQQFLKQCSWLKPVQEWILSIQLVFGRPRVRLPAKDSCIIVFARESVCLDTCPNHCNLRRLTICISGSNSPIKEVTSCVTEILVRCAVYGIWSDLRNTASRMLLSSSPG